VSRRGGYIPYRPDLPYHLLCGIAFCVRSARALYVELTVRRASVPWRRRRSSARSAATHR